MKLITKILIINSLNIFIRNKIRVISCIIYLFIFNILGAQNLDSVKVLISKNELISAKELIDEYVVEKPDEVTGYLLKAELYNLLSKDASGKDLVSDALQQSFTAIKKAFILDNKFVNNYLATSNYKIILDIYKGYSYEGVAFFNAAISNNSKSNFAASYNTFKKAETVSKYIYANGWGLSEIDTNNLYYLATSSIHTDNDNITILYCKKIADNLLVNSSNLKSFEQIYEWLVYYYKGKNEPEELLKYTEIANRLYPNSLFFEENYIEWLTDHKMYKDLMQRYPQLFQRGGNTKVNSYGYLAVMFNYLNTCEQSEKENLLIEFETNIISFLKDYPVYVEAKLLYSKHLLNLASNLQRNFYKGLSKKDFQALNESVKVYIIKANTYLKDIANYHKSANPVVYNNAIEILVKNLNFLGKTKEAKKYQAMRK